MRATWRDVLFGVVFLAPPFLKKILLRAFLGARIAPTARIGWFSAIRGRPIELDEHSVVAALTLVRCEGAVRLGRYSEVSSFVLVYGAGGFRLGDHSYVGPQCLINADEDVSIGNRSALGPRSMVFTHGSFLPYNEGYPVRLAGVTVGDRSWLAAGVFLHPGVHVGDDVLVNSRAVVSGDLPSGVVAEGAPARPLVPLERVRRRMSPPRVDAAMRHVLDRFADMELRRTFAIEVTREGRDAWRFRDGGCDYRLAYVPAADAAPAPALPPSDGPRRLIVLSSIPNAPTPGGPDVDVLDLAARNAPPSRDPVTQRLVEFLKRYYGIRLERGLG